MEHLCFNTFLLSDKRAAQRGPDDPRTQISVISRHCCGHHSRTSEFINLILVLNLFVIGKKSAKVRMVGDKKLNQRGKKKAESLSCFSHCLYPLKRLHKDFHQMGCSRFHPV